MNRIFNKLSLKPKNYILYKNFASSVYKLPKFADSVSEVTIKEYLKKEGDYIELDEDFIVLESAKGEQTLKMDKAGLITKIIAQEEEDVNIGDDLIEIDTDASKPEGEKKVVEKKVETPIETTKKEEPKAVEKKTEPKKTENKIQNQVFEKYSRNEKREKLSRMRRTVAERLKDSQNTNAQVTTFQELDMTEVMNVRKQYGEMFLKQHGIKLGFMSFFIKACAMSLNERKIVNAVIDGKEIIYKDYVDISVAVSSPTGLVVPHIKNCESKSLKEIEFELNDLIVKAREGNIAVEDLTGGTFTISNGGVFGSMLSVPIINPPQSAILGMHNIVNRPVVKNNKIESAPIMYLALSYDHRLLDGREGAGFLKRVRDLLQDPYKMLLDN